MEESADGKGEKRRAGREEQGHRAGERGGGTTGRSRGRGSGGDCKLPEARTASGPNLPNLHETHKIHTK